MCSILKKGTVRKRQPQRAFQSKMFRNKVVHLIVNSENIKEAGQSGLKKTSYVSMLMSVTLNFYNQTASQINAG